LCLFLDDAFLGEPLFEALMVDQAHRTGTFARRYQRVILLVILHQTYPADELLREFLLLELHLFETNRSLFLMSPASDLGFSLPSCVFRV